MKKHYRHETDCLNCGTQLEGKFCHNCGQENLEIKESFGHMMNHAVSDYFHFDQQFFSTLKPLFFSPGKLTNEYMAGKRAQYLHPVKMYIFISIVFFLLYFSDSNKSKGVKLNATPTKYNTEKIRDTISNAIAKDKNLSSYQKKKLQQQINSHTAVTIGKFGGDEDDNQPDNTESKKFDVRKMAATTDTSYSTYLLTQQKLPAAERDNLLAREWNKKVFDYYNKFGSRARDVFYDEFKHNVPKMMFLLLPCLALILKVAFWKNYKYYVEHLIYSFHLHCFLFLFLAIEILLQMIIPINWGLHGWISFLSFIAIVSYIYKSLKTVYHRSRFRTITKMIGMWFMYIVAFSACIMIVFFITALTAA